MSGLSGLSGLSGIFAPPSNNDWWLAGGVDLANVVAVYQADGAADIARSYFNIAKPGQYHLTVGGAPTWDSTGWLFNGSSQYLETGITADLTWSALVQFSDAPSGNQFIFGYYQGATLTFGIRPNSSNTHAYFNGATLSQSGGLTSGVLGFSGKTAYKDGVSDGALDAGGTANGQTLNIGRSNGVAIYYGGKVQKLFLANTALTGAQMTAISAAMLTAPAIPSTLAKVVCEGDSLTAGVGVGAGNNSYPNQMWGLLGNRYYLRNIATISHTLNNLTTDAAATDALIDGAIPKNIIVVWAGTNDIYGGQSGASTYAEYVTYCQARQSAGYTVIACTLTPRTDVGAPVDQETQRQAFNTNVRANWNTFASALADIGGDATIGAAGASNNATYYSDLVHLTAAGNLIAAGIVKAAILTV